MNLESFNIKLDLNSFLFSIDLTKVLFVSIDTGWRYLFSEIEFATSSSNNKRCTIYRLFTPYLVNANSIYSMEYQDGIPINVYLPLWIRDHIIFFFLNFNVENNITYFQQPIRGSDHFKTLIRNITLIYVKHKLRKCEWMGREGVCIISGECKLLITDNAQVHEVLLLCCMFDILYMFISYKACLYLYIIQYTRFLIIQTER